MNPGYFYKAFENTMNKFHSDLNKTEMVRYVAIDPVKPEFEVYEDRTVYMGLPEALLGSGNVVDPEVGVFFMQEQIAMVRVLLSKGEKGSFVDNLPLPVEIESAIPTGPDGRLTSPEDDETPNALASSNTPVVVIGNSNLKLISEELKKTIKDTVVYVKYPFNIFAENTEISGFIDSLELKKADVIVSEVRVTVSYKGCLLLNLKSTHHLGFQRVSQLLVLEDQNPRLERSVIRSRISGQLQGFY